MRIEVRGRNTEVTPEVREAIEKRFERIGRQVSELANLEVELFEERNPSIADHYVAEATLYLKGATRAREASPEMLHSIHKLAEDIRRQVKRHREAPRPRQDPAHGRAAAPPGGVSAKALVTGGSGFIGGRLIESLVADGHGPALARSRSSADSVAALGAEPVRGELGDPESLRAAATGCDVAFHAAAKVEDFGPWEEFERDNVQGTRNVAEACAAAGVSRLVHVSTEAVLIAGDPLVGVDETAPLRTDSRAPYSRSKALAERALLAADADAAEPDGVRPRFVWGAGDLTLLPEMVEMVRSGRFAWIGGGRHLTDTTHVDNVVRGLRLAADRAAPARRTSSPTVSRSSSATSSPTCCARRASSRRPGRSRSPLRACSRRAGSSPGACCRSAGARR